MPGKVTNSVWGTARKWGVYTSTQSNVKILDGVSGKSIVIDSMLFQNYSNSNQTRLFLGSETNSYTPGTGAFSATTGVGMPRVFNPLGSQTLVEDHAYRLPEGKSLYLSVTAASTTGYEIVYHMEP